MGLPGYTLFMKPRRPYTTDLRATQRAVPPHLRPRKRAEDDVSTDLVLLAVFFTVLFVGFWLVARS